MPTCAVAVASDTRNAWLHHGITGVGREAGSSGPEDLIVQPTVAAAQARQHLLHSHRRLADLSGRRAGDEQVRVVGVAGIHLADPVGIGGDGVAR